MNGRTGRGRPIPRGPGVAAFLVSSVSALVVVGPGLRPGYLLVRDMVFVPSPPLTGRLLGLGHENPRAVPSDLVVALLSHILPGDLVQKLVLVAILVAVGVGAARLAPRHPLAGSAAALVAIWNPYVGERLAMGQWALLVGYAALPWAVAGVTRLARGERAGTGGLVTALVLGSLGGGLAWVTLALATVATIAAVGVATGESVRAWVRSRWVLSIGVVLTLPWAVPAVLRPHPVASDPAGFSVFAPRADTPLGVVASLLTGGGSWNDQVVPPGRDTILGGVAALVLLGWSAGGYLLTRGAPRSDAARGAAAYRPAVLATGVVGLAVGLLSTWPALLEPLARVPGGGLLRDGSRQLGLWVLLLAVGAGWAVHWLAGRGVPRAAPVARRAPSAGGASGDGVGAVRRARPDRLPARCVVRRDGARGVRPTGVGRGAALRGVPALSLGRRPHQPHPVAAGARPPGRRVLRPRCRDLVRGADGRWGGRVCRTGAGGALRP